MKFALFFILSLVALQGFQARSVDEIRSLEPLAKGNLKSVIGHILETITRILEAINNVAAQIPDIVDSIASRIREVVARVQEVIQEINETVEELIEQGEIARQCVEEEREEINAVINLAKDGARKCIGKAHAETDNLQDQLRVLLGRAEALRDDIVDRIVECVQPSINIRCLIDQIDPIKDQIEILENEIDFTIRVAKETAVDVSNALRKCASELHEEIADKREQVLADIRQCIDAKQAPRQ